MYFETQSKKIVETAEELLKSGAVESVVGFVASDIEEKGIPAIINEASDTKRLIWSDRCVPNLASYALSNGGKVAVVAKPCDVRAIIGLITENQLKREKVHIIGVDCPGMCDQHGRMLTACQECKVHTPPLFDTHVESGAVAADTGVVGQGAGASGGDTTKAELENNLERFVGEMEKCILCFSCRQACYGCYCETCFMDRGVPDWQPTNPDMGAKMTYHLGRAMHLAGRCVECGACENTCASGVDVRYLIREVTGFVKELYDYDAGLDMEKTPAMLTYQPDDREVGFLGGEAHG